MPIQLHRLTNRMGKTWMLVLVGTAAALIVLVVVLIISGGGRPEISRDDFRTVELGDSKDEVEDTLGAKGQEGAFTSEIGGQEEEYDDCWWYRFPDQEESDDDNPVVCFAGDGEAFVIRGPGP